MDKIFKGRINIDNSIWVQLAGFLMCMYIPLLGPIIYGYFFTANGHFNRLMNGLICVGCFILHILLIIGFGVYFFIKH